MKKFLCLAACIATCASCANQGKMDAIEGYSLEEFKRTGSLPVAKQTRVEKTLAETKEEKNEGGGFFAKLFSGEKKKSKDKMAPIAGFSISDFVKSRKKNTPGPTQNTVVATTQRSAQAPPPDNTELRLPSDMLALPEDAQLRSPTPSSNRKSSVIARPPSE